MFLVGLGIFDRFGQICQVLVRKREERGGERGRRVGVISSRLVVAVSCFKSPGSFQKRQRTNGERGGLSPSGGFGGGGPGRFQTLRECKFGRAGTLSHSGPQYDGRRGPISPFFLRIYSSPSAFMAYST